MKYKMHFQINMKYKTRFQIDTENIQKCIEDIEKEIDIYAQINNLNRPDYLIMNEETMQLLRKDTFYYYLPKKGEKYFATFLGVPVAVCNNLKTGEVEII